MWAIMGAELTKDGLDVTAVYTATREGVVITGTSNGMLVGFDSSNNSIVDAGDVLFCHTLHNGPVLDIDMSTTSMLATSGYDATCAVFPFSAALDDSVIGQCRKAAIQQTGTHVAHTKRRSAEKGVALQDSMRRLVCHTLPVVALRFFSDGHTLATLSVRGQLTIVEVTTGSRLCEVQCGFAARALTLSPDDAYCYVGGTHLARVDVFAERRAHTQAAPLSAPFGYRDDTVSPCNLVSRDPRVQFYKWHDAQYGSTLRTAANIFICSVQVSKTTGALTATFAQTYTSSAGQRSAVLCATATWIHQVQGFYLASSSRRADETLPNDAVATLQTLTDRDVSRLARGVVRRAFTQKLAKMIEQKLTRPNAVQSTGSTLSSSRYNDSAATALVNGNQIATVSDVGDNASAAVDQFTLDFGTLTTLPRTPWTAAEEIQLQQERRRRLQDACSALALQLKQLS